MRTNIPQISKRVYKKDLLNVLEKKYPVIGPMWVSHQMEWCNAIYASFKDHNKFLILIYLIKKTLDFYSITLTKLTYVEFYSEDTVEIEKLNISDISKNINIPKESARRKIVELEAINAIIRKKKKILIDRSSFPFIKPINSIKRISRFISMFSKMLEEEKILEKQFSSLEIEKVIKENFSLVWKSYYELQIPMLMDYKKIFGDIESFHIWGTCAVNQHLYTQNVNDLNMSRSLFINSILFNKFSEYKDEL